MYGKIPDGGSTMIHEAIQFPAIGHLPGGVCAVLWSSTDLCTWCVVNNDTLPSPLIDCMLPLYATLRDKSVELTGKHLGSRLKVIIYNEGYCFELLPVWKDGILSRFERRGLASGVIDLIAKETGNASMTHV